MKKWEYKIEWFIRTTNEEIQEKINKLGSEGWELVSVSADQKSYVEDRPHLAGSEGNNRFIIKSTTLYYFKREI